MYRYTRCIKCGAIFYYYRLERMKIKFEIRTGLRTGSTFAAIAFYLFLSLLLISSCTHSEDNTPVRVAVFLAEKGVGPSANDLIDALKSSNDQNIEISRITSEEIRNGKLKSVNVLVHPGGSGGGQGRDLDTLGRKAVREFIRNGGGYLGVCAGAYLATNEYPWSLNLIDAKVVDRKHWARGKGMVVIEFSPEGADFFNYEFDEMMIYYGQGPLLARREWDDPEVPDYESLALYSTEIAEKEAPEGIMVGNSAIVRTEYGKGRVFCFSPHPEMTDGLAYMIPMAVKWLAVGR